jgi:hypothetical protein
MDRSSLHTVAHRRSLAYRMFKRAADSRDLFLGKDYKGDFLPTHQKYFTGISLRRYITLVCVEYPLVLIISLTTWLVLPSTFLYMLIDLVSGVNEGTLRGSVALWSFLGFLVATGLTVGLLFVIWSMIIAWAERGPSFWVKICKLRLHSGNDPDYDDFPDKFPGPIALLKKWLLSADSGESSKITWDSGKKREGW